MHEVVHFSTSSPVFINFSIASGHQASEQTILAFFFAVFSSQLFSVIIARQDIGKDNSTLKDFTVTTNCIHCKHCKSIDELFNGK